MIGFQRNKEAERYYLLPGMGGRNARRKHKMLLQWAIVVGLIASGILAAAFYLLSSSPSFFR